MLIGVVVEGVMRDKSFRNSANGLVDHSIFYKVNLSNHLEW